MKNSKEKAKELYLKFMPHCGQHEFGEYVGNEMLKNNAKQCALIACDEVLDIVQYNTDDEYAYWQEVKAEINNL
jgi:hypothetical protein